jgi:hypothetical protein
MSAALRLEEDTWGAMIVLDARIGVAEECIESMADDLRSKHLIRALDGVRAVRSNIEVFDAEAASCDSNAARVYSAAVRGWASDVACAVRRLAQEDDARSHREVAERSCATILKIILPCFAEVERSISRCDSTWSDLLRLQGSVVDLNWTLAL